MNRRRASTSRRLAAGFSIIELLVAVAIGLVVSLAMFGVLSASEGRKRTSVSMNDANQSGAYAAYTLDRVLRSAGTGFSQGWAKVGGCRLNAVLPSGTWPRTAALPAPFAAVPPTLRLAPIVIFQGASAAGSDVLMVMSGAAGFGESPTAVPLPSGITANDIPLLNTIGFRQNDLVLLSGGGECLLTQVASTKAACSGDEGVTTPTPCGADLPLGGNYYSAEAGNTSLSAMASLTDVNAFSIGNPTTNRPQFQLYGVGDNSTLFSHDLLLLNGSDTSQPIAEGVRELHAVYGLDTNDDGILDTWQAPTTGGVWDGEALMDGSPASVARLRQIVAVRIGLVMRSSLVEREIVAAEDLTLFSDLPSAVQMTVDLTRTSENRNQRHRTIEITVPVRNLLMRT